MRFFALASFALLALSTSGCGQDTVPTSRDLTGTVTAGAGQKITTVRAVEAGQKNGTPVTADVDGSGHFALTLATGKRYLITFTDGTETTGALRFPDGNGGYTALLPVTRAPAGDASAKPQGEGDGGGEVDDDDIGLGEVADADDDGQFEPSENPLDQVDSDDDGSVDSDDDDDDNDGDDDVDDDDDDDNGVSDDDESGDDDHDGVSDDLEDSDDGSGGSGGSDDGSGGSGGSGGADDGGGGSGG